MGKSLKGFHKWCVTEEGEGRYFHSRDEYETAKAGWIAALKWVRKEEKICGPLYIWIEEELNAKT